MSSEPRDQYLAICDELQRVVAERDAIAALLPGVYYMDPPDGGDVPLAEKMRRMAADAARYRWIKRQLIAPVRATCYERDYTVSILFRRRPSSLNGYIVEEHRGDDLDARIDAALAKDKP